MLDRTKVVYITPAGKELLEELYQRKLQRVAELARTAEPFEARSSGKCFGQEVADPLTEELNQLRADAERLHMEITHAVVLPTPTQKSEVEIGNGITLEYSHRLANGPRRVRKMFIVVGYGESNCSAVPQRLSYDSQLIKPFIGAQKGFTEVGWLDGKARVLRLTNIIIPK